VRDGDTFTEVPDEQIVKGYEHAKGHHVLIHPKQLEDLKLEAKHTIDMVRFVHESEIDARYLEKPYYLTPDGDEADEGYTVIRDALKQTRKVAIGQLVMNGREHLVGIKPHGKGLILVILRYANEVRPAEPYFDAITVQPKADAVGLASKLIEDSSGPFQPERMRDEYTVALQELVQAKIDQRAPEIAVEAKGEAPKVINIMAALKESVQAKGRAKVKEAVRKRSGEPSKEEGRPTPARSRSGARRVMQ
jgi:DNA end-binding protein Ku